MATSSLPRREARTRAALLAAAALWGFAEATFFFFVPDVLLSAIALTRRHFAQACCLAAVAGALPGGALMHAWGREDPQAARRFLDRVPAISAARVAQVGGEIEQRGLVALAIGPTRGTPYKIYAVQGGAAAVPLGRFLAASIPARWVRFALVAALAGYLAARLERSSVRRRYALWLGAWAAFYAVYFALVPG
jgi:membrane protein YqaA with SNARE-associated domain